MLEPEPAAGAAEPGLHLVDDQQRLALVAEAAHRFEVSGWRRLHAALPCTASSRTAQTRSSIAGERVEIGELDLAEPVGSGWNVSCFWGWPVAASVVSVRPWNELYAESTWKRSGPPLAWP